MFKEEFLEKIFSDKEMMEIPIGCQSTAVSVFERGLYKTLKENNYATISELFTDE